MPNWVNNTITINGQIAIAAAMAGTQLLITRVAAGSGVSAIAPFTMTTLVTPQLNLIPTPPQVTANNLQPGEIIVMATLDSANVTSTFSLTEMGVFAKSGSGPEVMIAYCQASSPYDSISPGSGSSRLQINEQIPIIVGVGASVSITVQAGNPVFVPPVVAGPGISVAAPTNSAGQVQQYIVSTPTLTVSATLNVAHGNNNVAPNFSSIQNALNYLSQYSIPSNVGMYINVAAGQYTGADAFFDCEHVNGSQITISGPQNGDQSFTAVSGTTSGAVTFYGLSGTTNFTVGFLCVVWYAGSNANSLYDPLLAGAWIVQSKTATTVTVYVPNGAIAGMGTFTGGWITPISVLMSPTPNAAGQYYAVVGSHGIGSIQYMGWSPTAQPPAGTTPGAVYITGPGSVYHCGVWGNQNATGLCHGFAGGGQNASVTFWRCGASACNNGFIAGGGSISCLWTAASYNTNNGYWSESGGYIGVAPDYPAGGGNAIAWSGANAIGFLVGNQSKLIIGAGYINGTLYCGNVYASYNSNMGAYLANQCECGVSTLNCIYYAGLNGANGDIYLAALSVWNAPRPGSIINGTVGVVFPGGIFAL